MKFWPFSKKATSYRSDMSPTVLLEELLSQGNSASGIPVNMTTAMGVVTVLACARVISNGLAQVPLKLLEPLPDGGTKQHTADIGRLLYRQPNKYQTAFRFRFMMGMHLALTGRFVAYVNRVMGEPKELLPLQPGAVEIRGTEWEPEYWVRFGKDQTMKKVAAENILHVVGPTLDGVQGLDVVKLARDAIGLSIATTTHASKIFSKGTATSGLYSTEQHLNSDQREQMLAALRQMEESSNGGAFKNLLLWGGIKYQHRSFAPEQAQLQQIRNQQVEEIARAFGVNPIMIGYTGDKTPTYASAEQLFISHVVYTMGPWYELTEQEFDRQLLTDKQKEAGWTFKHSVQGLMRGSHKDRAEYYTKLYGVGSLNPNEIRDLEDRNPYQGGDQYRVPLNMAAPGENPDEQATP